MKKTIIAAMILMTGCNCGPGQCNKWAKGKFNIIGVAHPGDGYCEYKINDGYNTLTIVDSIGKYHIGQQITLP